MAASFSLVKYKIIYIPRLIIQSYSRLLEYEMLQPAVFNRLQPRLVPVNIENNHKPVIFCSFDSSQKRLKSTVRFKIVLHYLVATMRIGWYLFEELTSPIGLGLNLQIIFAPFELE